MMWFCSTTTDLYKTYYTYISDSLISAMNFHKSFLWFIINTYYASFHLKQGVFLVQSMKLVVQITVLFVCLLFL